MTQRIELSNGAWADLREPEAVSVKLRRPVEKALMAIAQGKARAALEGTEDLTDEERASEVAATLDLSVIDQFNDLNDQLIIARLEAWSLDLPITLDNVLDLPDGDYKKLQEVAAAGVMNMMPNFKINDAATSPTKPSDV